MKKRLLAGLIVTLGVALWMIVSDEESASSTVRQTSGTNATAEPSQLTSNASLTSTVEPPPTDGRTLIVEVTNTKGTPIGGATVQAQTVSPGQYQKTTGEDGIVEFNGLSEHLPLRVHAQGYESVVQPQPNVGSLQEALWTIALKQATKADSSAPKTSGWVSIDNQAVKGALLIFENDGTVDKGHPVIRSGPSGRFVMPDSISEATRVHALSTRYGFASILFHSGQELHLELPGGGFMEGRVVADKGLTLQGFGIRASSRGMPFPSAIRKAMKNRKSKLSSALRSILRGVNETVADKATFSLGPLAPGTYTVYAHAKGMQPDEPKKITLDSGDTVSGLIFRLGSPLIVSGTVTDKATGRPIRDAAVQVGLWGRRKTGDFGHAKTNADGEFTLRTKADERHRIQVSAKGYLTYSQGGLEGQAGGEVQRDYQLSRRPKQAKGRQREYVGVGIQIIQTDDGVKVHSLLDGSPSKGILQKGDILLMANDVWLDDVSLKEAGETMVGEPGTNVEVLFLRFDAKTQSSNEYRRVIRRERILHTIKRH